jgi:hypothetical protein
MNIKVTGMAIAGLLALGACDRQGDRVVEKDRTVVVHEQPIIVQDHDHHGPDRPDRPMGPPPPPEHRDDRR